MRDFIQKHHLILHDAPLLVAVSGGPDSVCLLDILVKLQDKLNIRLHVAHLNHQLRGAESEADAQYVAELAHRLGVPATIGQRDVKAYRREHHASLEEAAREVRYAFLAETARKVGADRVAVGHTRNDNIETILMHLLRGTGTRGLRGLQPNSRWPSSDGGINIIRPLLPVSRQETADYCQAHRLAPRLDSSNLSLSPLRNRIRLELLPLLQSYNPQVTEALLRTAAIADDELALWEKESAQLWSRLAQKQGDTIILDKAELLKLPPARQRHLLRQAIAEQLSSLKDIEMRHIESIMAVLAKPAGKRLSLPGGLVFTVDYRHYRLGPDSASQSPFPALKGEFILKLPGETALPGWRVVATITSPAIVEGKPGNDLNACLDFDKTGSKVVVRCRQAGDRFQPLGLSQPKKLGEFMIDAKIPRPWRQRVPVVSSPQHILWLVGWRIDDRVKVTPNTKRVLRLEFQPASDAESQKPTGT